MPELPDVEGFRRYARRHGAGKRVERVEAEPEIVRNSTPQGLGRALSGRRLGAPERRGKWLVWPVEGRALLLHFGMTGLLAWNAEPHEHDRLSLRLEDGDLRYRAMRKLGGVWFVGRAGDVEDVTGPLGPDALRVSPRRFVERLRERRGGVKAALMDQRTVAGLGNLTVDEVLWRARIDPRRRIDDLEDRDLERLERTTKDVLRRSSRRGRVPDDGSWLTGRRREDGTCPRCGAALDAPRIAGRTTYLCPRCQA